MALSHAPQQWEESAFASDDFIPLRSGAVHPDADLVLLAPEEPAQLERLIREHPELCWNLGSDPSVGVRSLLQSSISV